MVEEGKIGNEGVNYDPYDKYSVEGTLLAIVKDGQLVSKVKPGDQIEVMLPETPFYIESGGQVSDTGSIVALAEPTWEVRVIDMRQPSAGVIVHIGEVIRGEPQTGDRGLARVDVQRRRDIMRNHTATHLLHAELHAVLGDHARQAGSLVAPDRLRFDFTNPEAVTPAQIQEIEAGVNRKILDNHSLNIVFKPLQQAMAEGAIALFGEKYDETVRTITIGGEAPFSYELCGGTHVSETGDIGTFLITGESSVGAGLRRIEALTGMGAYQLVQRRFLQLNQAAGLLETNPDQIVEKTRGVLEQLEGARKSESSLRRELIAQEFNLLLESVPLINRVPVLTAIIPEADGELLRELADRFRQQHPSGVILLASVSDGRPLLIAAVTEDLVERGLHAGELVKYAAQPLGGSGGGRPTLAQAGGKDASQLDQAVANADKWIQDNL